MLKRLIVLILFMLLTGAGCVEQNAPPESQMAADFTLQDLRGNNVTLSDYKGRVVLLEFWTTWCPTCRAAVPILEKLHRTYKDKGLVVLSVSFDFGAWDELQSFVAEQGVTYTVLKGTDKVAVQYQVRTIPMLLVLNKEGKISKRYLGMRSADDLDRDIKAFL